MASSTDANIVGNTDDAAINEDARSPRADNLSLSAEDAGESTGIATQIQLDRSRDFKPFFTLIEDTQTDEHHHPSVYYVFQDDDPDVVVSATLSALESGYGQTSKPSGDENERILIVDMASDGKQVERVVSLSPDWQSLTAQVSPAPSWAHAARETERGLMLTVSGRENNVPEQTAEPANARNAEHIENLIRIFEQRLDELHAVLGESQNQDREETLPS